MKAKHIQYVIYVCGAIELQKSLLLRFQKKKKKVRRYLIPILDICTGGFGKNVGAFGRYHGQRCNIRIIQRLAVYPIRSMHLARQHAVISVTGDGLQN
jgi:hypothetical protein